MNADKTGKVHVMSRGCIHRLEDHMGLGVICVHLRSSADTKLFAGVIRLLLALGLLLSPCTRAAEEVPFVTTPDNVTLAMLEMAKVGPRDFVIDLGSGD